MQLDHIILAINNLEKGVRQFESMTGIEPIYGGEHPNWDTQNAIIPLHHHMYIEIMAPKNDLEVVPDFLKNINTLKPIGFAMATHDINQMEKTIQQLNYKSTGIQAGSRVTPQGQQLKWSMLTVTEPNLGMNPFFISWSDDTGHPSLNSTKKYELKQIIFKTPYHHEINNLLASLDTHIVSLQPEHSKQTTLEIALKSPKGDVLFT